MMEFIKSIVLMLPLLSRLAVCNNKLIGQQLTLHNCHVVKKEFELYVNCSFRDLKNIPYRFPKLATSIDLSNNNVTSITSNVPFLDLSMLRELNLSNNPLQYIWADTFNGLLNLTSLIIRNSLLYEQKSLILDTLLDGLRKIKYFSFTFALPDSRRITPVDCKLLFKSQPFGKVDSLQWIDHLDIDSALLKWKNLSMSTLTVYQTKSLYLINGRVCYYPHMSKDQFEYMPFLETVKIENPFATGTFSDDFIATQIQLKELGIYGTNALNAIPSEFIYNVTKSVSQLYNLISLSLDYVSRGKRIDFSCFYIYDLRALHNLTTISLAGNSLTFTIIECQFPNSLKHLMLQENCLTSFQLQFSVIYTNEQIETIDARDQSKCSFTITNSRKKYTYQRKSKSDGNYSLKSLIFTNSSDELYLGHGNSYFGQLNYLDLSLNNKVHMTMIPIFFSSTWPHLQYLNMSNCRITGIEKQAFSNFTRLKYLDLSENLLGKMECGLSDNLKNLQSLNLLNIANNHIKCLTRNVFSLMKNVYQIDISNNKLRTFEADLYQATRLKFIDISSNRLQKLSESNMNDLDRLANRNAISIDLSGNVLLCTCETIEFLKWIKSTRVKFLNRDEYICSFSDGKTTSLKAVSSIVKTLTSECASKAVVTITVTATVATSVVALCAILSYRYRWKIRYFYYRTKIKIPYKLTKKGYEQIFDFDAFVSYSSDDFDVVRNGATRELEESRDLRLCLHERDFKPGESIAFNISRGIRCSKRTFLFISTNFLTSEWCMFELNISRMESLHTGRKVIMVILMEDIPNGSLPIDVLDIINNYTYLEYPKNGAKDDLNVFWSKCADFITND